MNVTDIIVRYGISPNDAKHLGELEDSAARYKRHMHKYGHHLIWCNAKHLYLLSDTGPPTKQECNCGFAELYGKNT
jgi:hypothetical protein